MLSIAEADPTNLTAAIGDGGNDISMLQVEEIASTTSTEEDVVYSWVDQKMEQTWKDCFSWFI